MSIADKAWDQVSSALSLANILLWIISSSDKIFGVKHSSAPVKSNPSARVVSKCQDLYKCIWSMLQSMAVVKNGAPKVSQHLLKIVLSTFTQALDEKRKLKVFSPGNITKSLKHKLFSGFQSCSPNPCKQAGSCELSRRGEAYCRWENIQHVLTWVWLGITQTEACLKKQGHKFFGEKTEEWVPVNCRKR